MNEKMSTEEKNKIISQKLNEAANYLISKGVLSAKSYQKVIAEKTGVVHTNISSALNGNTRYSTSGLAKKFNASFGDIFNEEWLLGGEGDMLKGEAEHKIETINLTAEPSTKGVPYFETTEATGTILSMYKDTPETPAFYINYEHFNDCTAYIPVVGDSMYPKYCSGEIVAVKQIFNFDMMLWGETYLVVTDDAANNLRTIKDVHPCEGDDTKVVLRASNPNFKGDTVIPKEHIISMFIIKGKIKRNQL